MGAGTAVSVVSAAPVTSAGVSTAASVEASTGAASVAVVSSVAMGSDFSTYRQLVLTQGSRAYLGGLDLLLLGRLLLGAKELGKEAFTLGLGLLDLVLHVSLLRVGRKAMGKEDREIVEAEY